MGRRVHFGLARSKGFVAEALDSRLGGWKFPRTHISLNCFN